MRKIIVVDMQDNQIGGVFNSVEEAREFIKSQWKKRDLSMAKVKSNDQEKTK
jgi:hypothetical protein